MSMAKLHKTVSHAMSLQRQGESEEALDLLHAAVFDRNADYIVWALMGSLNTDIKDWESAALAFEQASSIRPGSEPISFGLYGAYTAMGLHEAASEEMIRFTNKYDSTVYDQIMDHMTRSNTLQ